MGNSRKLHDKHSPYRKTPEEFRKFGESTHGEGRHHPHKRGDRISFRTPEGRESGTVIKATREFYYVGVGDDVVKVNRNSILYAMGTFVGGIKQRVDNVKKSYEFGKEKENERLEKYKANYGRKKAPPKAKPKPKPKKK
jgi:hypothetical protein